ncbi:MAG: methyltransferase domain-containing protein [Siphonobacter sp.]
METQWNATLYDTKHDFVSKYGEDVVRLLNPQAGEKILDVGCGTGDLAAMIEQTGAKVTGVDASADMIAQAKNKFPKIVFDVAAAEDLTYNEQFDAVFSNATLHWVLEKEKAVECMYTALKPGGRLVAEFGGKDNVASIVSALKTTLIQAGFAENAQRSVWYFPSPSEYMSLLESRGFTVRYMVYFDRETKLADRNGLKNWLMMFGSAFLKGLTEPQINQVLDQAEKVLITSNFREGNWYADYKRLRFIATK